MACISGFSVLSKLTDYHAREFVPSFTNHETTVEFVGPWLETYGDLRYQIAEFIHENELFAGLKIISEQAKSIFFQD